jgi:hypothetical protein
MSGNVLSVLSHENLLTFRYCRQSESHPRTIDNMSYPHFLFFLCNSKRVNLQVDGLIPVITYKNLH